MNINERLEAIERRDMDARDRSTWKESGYLFSALRVSQADVDPLLALARYIIPIAEDHLTIDESREFKKRIEEILDNQ